MTSSVDRKQKIQQLITKSEDFESTMARWQSESTVTRAELTQTQSAYMEWYSQAQRLIKPDQLDQFRDMYEGGEFIKRIRAYLHDPVSLNQLYQEVEPNPLISKWRIPFEGTVRESLIIQRDLLVEVMHDADEASLALDDLTAYFRRLSNFLRTLKNKANTNVPSPNITVEKDLQIVILALLRFLYRDVRPEDPASRYAGASSRVDFSIRDVNVVVETKMVRKDQTDKDVGNELLIDWGRYPKHPNCQGIFAIIYDPREQLDNPSELEGDLTQIRPGLSTRAIVVR